MRSELRSGIFFFLLSLLVMGESLRVELGTFMEPGSGFLPFGMGLVMCALSVVLIWRGWGVRESQIPHSRRVVLALASLFVYSLVLNILGFVVATFFLVAILFQLGQSRQWWLVIGMSALVTFLAYLIFGVFLHVYFPIGFLGI
jgi:putative tricarboxylic transport membrane protein